MGNPSPDKFSVAIQRHFGIVALLIGVFLIGWIVVSVGDRIVNSVPRSKIYDTQKDAQRMMEVKK